MSSQDDPPSKDFPEWDGWNVKDIEGSHMTYKALLRSTNRYTEEEITILGQLALRSQTEKWKSELQSKYMERFDSFGPAQSKWAEDRFTLFLKQQEKSVSEKDAYRHLVDSFLDDFVKTELGEDVVCRFHGSSLSGLCIGDSDVDLVLCLYGNTKRAFQERAVKRMQKDAAKALQQQPQTRHRVTFWGRRMMARAWRMDAQAALDLASTNEYEVSDRVLSVSAILFLAKALCKKNACGGYRLAQRAKSGKEKPDKDVDTRIFAGCPVLVAHFAWWDDMGVEKRLRLNVSLFDIKAVTNTVFLRDLVSLDDRIRKLILAVKLWARAAGLTRSSDGMFSGFVWSVLTVIFLQDMGVLPCGPAALVAMKQRAAAQVYVLGGTSRGSALFPPLPPADAKKGELPMPNLSVCTILNAFFFFLSDILQKREEKKKSSSSSSAAASSSGEVADRQEEREAEGGSDEGHEKRVEGGERTAEQSESRDDSVGRDGDAGRGRGSETPLSTGGDREGEREGASSDADSDAESFVEGQRDREGEGENEEDRLLLSLRLSETDDEASVWRPFSTLSLEGLEGEWQTKETLRKAAGRALVALEWEGTVKTIAVKHLSLFRKRVHDAVTEVEAWDVHCEKEEGEQERELRDFWMQRQIETLTNARMSSLSKKSVREEEEEASASSDAASKSIRLTNPPNSQPSDTSNVALPLLPNPVPSVPFPVQPNLLPSFHPMSLGNSFFSPTVPLMSANAAFPGWQGRGGLGMGGQPIGTQGVGQSVRPALMQSSSSSSSSSSSVLPMAAAQGQMGKNAPLFAFPPRPLGQGTYVKASFKGNNRKNKKK